MDKEQVGIEEAIAPKPEVVEEVKTEPIQAEIEKPNVAEKVDVEQIEETKAEIKEEATETGLKKTKQEPEWIVRLCC